MSRLAHRRPGLQHVTTEPLRASALSAVVTPAADLAFIRQHAQSFFMTGRGKLRGSALALSKLDLR